MTLKKKKSYYQKVLDYIINNPGTDSEFIAKHFKISDQIACEITRDLANAGLIGKYKGK